MNRIISQIPNTLTSLNLFFGAIGAYLALSGRPDLTVVCILIAALFDFFDGFAARLLHAKSPIGKDLDSLADLVSFGFAPAACFSSLLHFAVTGQWSGQFFAMTCSQMALVLAPFLLTVFSAVRLAKFNNDSRQTESFIGLTTTATGMFSSSFVYLTYTSENIPDFVRNPIFVLAIIALFSFLLLSEIPMFSLKFKHFKFKGNENRYILLVLSLALLIFFGLGSLTFIIPLYVCYSVGLMVGKRND